MTTIQTGTLGHQQRYRIRQQLGKGGFGAVYLADDSRLPGRQVALKENLGVSKESQQQFKREALLLARLRHPNLPQVTDYFFDPSGKQYLVMDYVPGDNLRQVMARRQGPLPVEEVLAAAEQVMQALAYMHAWRDPESGQIKPIIHRDIKPDNIKRTPDGRIVLVDFGIAKVDSDTATALSARALTPGYAPIEQYHGGTDERSDVYALGATIYALLTGKAPPSATSLATGMPLPPPRTFNAEIPMRCAKVIEKAMQLKPEQRYQTVGDMYRALFDRTMLLAGSVAKSEPVRSRTATLRLPSGRVQRSPLIAGVLLLGALLIMVGGWLALANPPDMPTVVTTTPAAVAVVVTPAEATPVTGGGPTFTPAPVATDPATPLPSATSEPSSTPEPTASFTATPDATGTAAAEATVRQQQIELQVAAALEQQEAVAATLTALAPTATSTPRNTNTPRATPTPYPTDTPYPTHTPRAQDTPRPAATYTPQPTYTSAPPPQAPTNTPAPPPPPPAGDSQLASDLRQRARSSWVPNPYPGDSDRFVNDLVGRLYQFQLPNLGVTQSSMTDALRRSDAGDRTSAIVGRIWGDWLGEAKSRGVDAYTTDPGITDMSPLRLLVVRMIQGRQGALVDSQQHALHNLYTRPEESRVWVDNVNGVIAAVNRSSFQWQ